MPKLRPFYHQITLILIVALFAVAFLSDPVRAQSSNRLSITSTPLLDDPAAAFQTHFLHAHCPSLAPSPNTVLESFQIRANDPPEAYTLATASLALFSAAIPPATPFEGLKFTDNTLIHVIPAADRPSVLPTSTDLAQISLTTTFSAPPVDLAAHGPESTLSLSLSLTFSGPHISTQQLTSCILALDHVPIFAQASTLPEIVPTLEASLSPHPLRSDDSQFYHISAKVALGVSLSRFLTQPSNPTTPRLALKISYLGPIRFPTTLIDINNHRIRLDPQALLTTGLIHLPEAVATQLLGATNLSINYPADSIQISPLSGFQLDAQPMYLSVQLLEGVEPSAFNALTTWATTTDPSQPQPQPHFDSPLVPQQTPVLHYRPIFTATTRLAPGAGPVPLPEEVLSMAYHEPHTNFAFFANAIAFTQNHHHFNASTTPSPWFELTWTEAQGPSGAKTALLLQNATSQFQFNSATSLREGLFTKFVDHGIGNATNLVAPLLGDATVHVSEDNLHLDNSMYVYHYGYLRSQTAADGFTVQEQARGRGQVIGNGFSLESTSVSGTPPLSDPLQMDLTIHYSPPPSSADDPSTPPRTSPATISTYQIAEIAVYDPLPFATVAVDQYNSFKDSVFSRYLTNDLSIRFGALTPGSIQKQSQDRQHSDRDVQDQHPLNSLSSFAVDDPLVASSTGVASTAPVFPNTIDLCVPLLNLRFKAVPSDCSLALSGLTPATVAAIAALFPQHEQTIAKTAVSVPLARPKAYPYCLSPTWPVAEDYSQDAHYRGVGNQLKHLRFSVPASVIDVLTQQRNAGSTAPSQTTLQCAGVEIGVELYKQRVAYNALFPLFFNPHHRVGSASGAMVQNTIGKENDSGSNDGRSEAVADADLRVNSSHPLHTTASASASPPYYEEPNLNGLLIIQTSTRLPHPTAPGIQTIASLSQHTVRLTLVEPPVESNTLRIVLLTGFFMIALLVVSYGVRVAYKRRKHRRRLEQRQQSHAANGGLGDSTASCDEDGVVDILEASRRRASRYELKKQQERLNRDHDSDTNKSNHGNYDQLQDLEGSNDSDVGYGYGHGMGPGGAGRGAPIGGTVEMGGVAAFVAEAPPKPFAPSPLVPFVNPSTPHKAGKANSPQSSSNGATKSPAARTPRASQQQEQRPYHASTPNDSPVPDPFNM